MDECHAELRAFLVKCDTELRADLDEHNGKLAVYANNPHR